MRRKTKLDSRELYYVAAIVIITLALVLYGCATSQPENGKVSAPEQQVAPPSTPVNNPPTTQPPAGQTITEKVNAMLLNEIKSGSDKLLPTLDDLPTGWEINSEEPALKSDVTDQDISNGWIDGYYRDFQKGQASLADLENYVALETRVHLFSTSGAKATLQQKRDELSVGSRVENQTSEETNYDSTSGEMVTENVTKEVTIKISILKNPNIGDDSIFSSETTPSDSIWGELKEYSIRFVKKNAYVRITCRSMNSDNCLGTVSDVAHIIEKKI